MNNIMLKQAVFFVLVCTLSLANLAADYEPDSLTVSAASLLGADKVQGDHYSIADDVLVSGYMNHYTVNSDYGQFTAVGDRQLKKLLHEIDAITQLKAMTQISVGTDAVIGAVADTGKSLVALAKNPVGSVNNLETGMSRLFKRYKKTATDVSSQVTDTVKGNVSGEDHDDGSDDSDVSEMTSQLASAYLGIGKAQREIAANLKVDPYSDNPVLQAELARVAKVSGTVGKIADILIPLPSVVGTVASVSDMVWNLSPTDLLIQNQETLKSLGYSDAIIQQYFANKMYSPTERTAFVAAVKSLDSASGREILMNEAVIAQSAIEGEFMVRSTLFAQLYHEQIEPIVELFSSPNTSVPVAVTSSGDGLIFAPLDHLLWTEQVEEAVTELARLMDQHGSIDERLLWIEGNVSELAYTNLKNAGWVESSDALDKLETTMQD